MRYLLIVSAILSFAQFGFSESLNSDQVILSKSTAGGHVPPDMYGWGREILIYESGTIMIHARANSESPWIDKILGVINQEVMEGIKADLAGLRSGEIVFPDQEGCFDMPSTSYTGLNEDNEMVEFSVYSRCLLGELVSFSNGWRLQGILDGMGSLSNYLN